jgi:hypothetical protein
VLSLSKLLLLAAVVAAVWFVVRALARRAGTPAKTGKRAAGGAVELAKCPRCDIYIGRDSQPCPRADCPQRG